MSKTARPLHEAEAIAAQVVTDLSPYCERIEVAGSVRRRKEQVGDIEIVAIPRYELGGLFATHPVNTLWAYLEASTTYRLIKGKGPDGRYYQLVRPDTDDVQIDLFIAQEDNWGYILLLRTGSAAFGPAVLARWKHRQWMRAQDEHGSVDGHLVTRAGEIVPTPDEETVFRLVGLDPVPPEERTDEAARRLGG